MKNIVTKALAALGAGIFGVTMIPQVANAAGSESLLGTDRYSSFVRIGTDSEEWGFTCGGVAISNNFVVTAKHCFVKNGQIATNAFIYNPEDGDEAYKNEIKGDSFYLHPDSDIALIRVPRLFGDIKPVSIDVDYGKFFKNNLPVDVVGNNFHANGKRVKDLDKSVAHLVTHDPIIDKNTNVMTIWYNGPRDDAHMMSPGDSGSPVYHNGNLIGIHYGSHTYDGMAYTFYGSVLQWMNNIMNNSANNTNNAATTQQNPVPANTMNVTTSRIAGTDRFDTSVKVFNQTTDNGNTNSAVLATGLNFADGLTGGVLAGHLNTGILLTGTNSIPENVKATLANPNIKDVYIVGGLNAISTEVENQLATMGKNVIRIAGTDRFDTSRKVAEKVGGSENIIASGLDYPDALTASVLAIKNHANLILVREGNEVPAKWCVGGKVCSTSNSSVRMFGADRYITSLSVAIQVGNTSDVVVASGLNFADALVAAPLAAKLNKSIVLTDGKIVKMVGEGKSAMIIGGNSAVSDNVAFVKED